MTFLAPAWLLLLALVGVVLVLHARRRRRVEIASVRLWKLIETAGAQRRALRRPPASLALLLQVLAVVAIALALAQPRFGAAGPGHTIFLIDTSAAMHAAAGATTRFDVAREHLEREIRAATAAGDRVSVIVGGAPGSIAVARQETAAGSLPIVASLQAGDGPSAWDAAAAWIEPVIREEEVTRAVILADDAGVAAGRAAVTAIQPDMEVRARSFGGAVASAGIAATVTPVEGESERWRIDGEVSRTGDAGPAAVAVRFVREGASTPLDFGTIPLDGPESGSASFSTELAFPGGGQLTLALPEDASPSDDAARFILRSGPRAARVLFLGRQDAAILRALAATGNVEIFTTSGDAGTSTVFDLTVVNDIAVDRAPPGNVLWFGRGRVGAGDAPPPLVGDLTGWNAEHLLSVDLTWTALATPRGFSVPRLPGAVVLAESAGAPLVQARTTPAGREVRVALDPVASNWVTDPSFPVFLGNVMTWLGLDLAAAPEPCVAGAACPLPAAIAGAAIVGPDGGIVRPALGGTWVAPGAETFVPVTAGFYRVDGRSGPTFLAVNAPPLTATPPVASPGSEPAGMLLPSLWWVLVALALVLLLVEGWLSGRGPEKFLRREALRSAMPHSGRRRALLGLRIAAAVAALAALVSLPFPERRPSASAVAVTGLGADRGVGEVVAALPSGDGETPGVGLVAASSPPGVIADLGGAARAASVSAEGDLEGAVSLALAMLPADRPGRVLLAADGNETNGAIGSAQPALLARGAALDLAPLPAMAPGEVLVEAVEVSPGVRSGESFPAYAVLLSAAATDALVTVFRNDERLIEQPVTLAPGRNRTEVLVPAVAEAGTATVEFAVAAAGDVVPGNNRAGVAVEIFPTPSVLIVTPDPGAGGVMADALGVQGLEAAVVAPEDTPWYIEDWLAHDLVVLMNVPAIALDSRKQGLLEDLVRIHGRGLLILGGERAYGPGGYYRTPLERLSPLSSRVPHDAPRAAMVYVLDRSGSMQGRVEDATRLDIAREATLGAIELLHEESQVGVIVFDSEPHVIVPLQERKDEAAIAAALAPLVPGGGTKLYPALAAAIEELRGVDSEARHIVVMSDGLLEPADFPGLLAEAAAAGITVSAVAVGSAADRRLAVVAELGGGAFHATQDFKALPSILSQEALMLSGDPVEQGVREVFWIDRDPALFAGLPDELPPVQNYVPTTLQPTATLHLGVRDEEGETAPILASWRYGNGRVMALATHGAGSGTARWMTMPEYPLLWAQVVRQLLPAGQGPGLGAAASWSADALLVTAELLDEFGEPVSGAEVAATLAGTATAVALMEEAPGRYTNSVPAGAPGLQTVSVAAGDMTAVASVLAGYPARLGFGRADSGPMTAVALATGGDPAAELAGLRPPMAWAIAPAWRPWLIAALALLLADLFVRYGPGLLGRSGRNRRPVVTTAS